MVWQIVEQDDQFCLEDTENPDAAGACYATRAEADDALAEKETNADASGAAGTVFITIEGMETSDGRLFELGGLAARDVLPIPLMVQDRAEHGGWGGDTTSWFAGAIYEVFRDPRDETRWLGRFALLAGEQGDEAERLIRGGLRGVSVDASMGDVSFDVRKIAEDGWPLDILYRFSESQIMGATVTPFPAFDVCTLWFDDEDEPAQVAAAHGEEVPMTTDPEVVTSDEESPFLLASGGPENPPRSWFEMPEPDELTPLTVLDTGQVYGHIAPFSQCHIGMPGTCVTAPRSPSDYAYFHTGEVVCDDGSRVMVGNLTMDAHHADRHETAAATMAHYDHTATAVADLHARDGLLGVWVCGAARPGLTAAQSRTLMAAAPSGDWRRIGGSLELVAALCVNVPGFPVPRTEGLVAGGAQMSLVAAGVIVDEDRSRSSFMEAMARLVDERIQAAFEAMGTPAEQVIAEAQQIVDSMNPARRVTAPPLNPKSAEEVAAAQRQRAIDARAREIKAAARGSN